MTDAPRQTDIRIHRVPDCVTEVRKGNTLITVSGYFNHNATENAIVKMEKVIRGNGVTATILPKVQDKKG